jgi:hypothetical protein
MSKTDNLLTPTKNRWKRLKDKRSS